MDRKDNWRVVIRDAWRAYHNDLHLRQTALGNTALVAACKLPEDTHQHQTSGVRAILLWSLWKLTQMGNKKQIERISTLRLRYVEGLTVAQVARQLDDRPESTIKRWQKNGIQESADVIIREIAEQQNQAWYRSKSIELRLGKLSPPATLLVHFLAVFRTPIPLHFVSHVEYVPIQTSYIQELQQANLIVETNLTLHLHSEVWQSVYTLTNFDHHKIAATLYTQENQIGEAIYHWQRAGQIQHGAKLLLTRAGELSTNEVLALLRGFDKQQMPRDILARLYLLEGQTIEQSDQFKNQIDIAIEKYEAALKTDNVLVQAEANYCLARTHHRRNPPNALPFYSTAIADLSQTARSESSRQLLIKTHISRAWLYIDQMIDHILAEEDLFSAEKILQDAPETQSWLRLRSDWHNAWAGLYKHQKQQKKSEQHGLKAWLLAQRSGDVTRTIQTSYSLGVAYSRMGQFEESYRFLRKTQHLANDIGNGRMTALCYKAIGNCYVRDGQQFDKAWPLYNKAYDYFKQSGNRHYLAGICYDLTEAHITQGQIDLALQFLGEGTSLIKPDSDLGLAFAEMQQTFIELSSKLCKLDQRKIVRYVRLNNKITNKLCREQLNISDRQALRELDLLVANNTLQRIGKGRGVKYIFHPTFLTPR